LPAPACGSGVAGLAGILKHVQHAGFHGALEIGVIQQNVGRLAAELLVYSFDGVSSQLGDFVPARVDPVNDTMSTSGCDASAAPTSMPCR